MGEESLIVTVALHFDWKWEAAISSLPSHSYFSPTLSIEQFTSTYVQHNSDTLPPSVPHENHGA